MGRYDILLNQPSEPVPKKVEPNKSPAQPTVPRPSQPPQTLQGGKEGSREVGREDGKKVGRPTPAKLFDISLKPYRKDSFLFTDEEFEALEDLKTQLRRQYDLKATKNDLARCALEYLLEDYESNKDNSIIVTRLKTKVGK